MQNHNEDEGRINRRSFLKYVVVSGAGLVTVSVGAPLVTYFLAPSWKQTQNNTYPIARTNNIPVGVPTLVKFEERVPDAWITTTESKGLWVVTKDSENFTVFDPHCTHLNCPYYWDNNEGIFVCPCHGGRFDIDGNVIAGPPPRPLDRWEHIISNGEIEITGRIIKG